MTVQDFANWCNQQIGKALDYDGVYGPQCTDLFCYAYKHLTGRNPYADGYAVPGAKDIWNVATARFTKVRNNPHDPNQLPPRGAILVYDGALPGSGGMGHVAIVDSANVHSVTVWDQNWGGQFVHHQAHVWNGHEIGWLIFRGYTAPPKAPSPAPTHATTSTPVTTQNTVTSTGQGSGTAVAVVQAPAAATSSSSPSATNVFTTPNPDGTVTLSVPIPATTSPDKITLLQRLLQLLLAILGVSTS